MIKRAIISVFDKSGVVELAKKLRDMGIEILSTGGTLKALTEAGVEANSVSDVTGFPECFGGRVKTLHPRIHGGILALRGNDEHRKKAEELGIEMIDLVVINLYPFHQTIMKDGVTLPEAIENIDIGGPAMLRAAAKNFKDVTVVVDPKDYGVLIGEIQENGGSTSRETRLRFAEKAFSHTAQYDALISGYLRAQIDPNDIFPEKLTLTYQRKEFLRYGENPHQRAAFYQEMFPAPGCVSDMLQLGGSKLSYNNMHDADIALNLLREFKDAAVVAAKQANPCGVGVDTDICAALQKCQSLSAMALFSSVVAMNREVHSQIARELIEKHLVCVIAPSFTEEALEILSTDRKLALLKVDTSCRNYPGHPLGLCKVSGGLLVQDIDDMLLPQENIRIVTDKNPEKRETMDAVLAWTIAKHVDSNAIVVAKDGVALSIGSDAASRMRATLAALRQNPERIKGAALASDAFFLLPDAVKAAAKLGISIIIQPGGSPTDDEAIEICNYYNMVMLFTDMRHFRH